MAAVITLMRKEPRWTFIHISKQSRWFRNIIQTYLVTGGYGNAKSSTELLVETGDAWVYTGELPSPRQGIRGVNIDNKILMTGIEIFLLKQNYQKRFQKL